MGLRREQGLWRVGFWAPASTTDWVDLVTATLNPLPRAADCVDTTWDMTQRGLVYRYVTDERFRGQSYCGSSTCRICGLHPNGSADYSDGVYLWPQGFGHYIRSHFVVPPREFIRHVLRQVDQQQRPR